MAAPVTHIVLASKILPRYFSKVDKAAFIVGTSFPDIRYLKVIEREKTHVFTGDIASISQTNSFEAGVNLHVLVDHIRGEYMKQKSIYDLTPQSPFITQALKIYEDQVLCSKIGDWQEIAKYFQTIYPEEQNYEIPEGKIKEWHELISEYLSEQPAQEETIKKFIIKLTLPTEVANEIAELVQKIAYEGKVKKLIEDFYSDFEDLLK